jgi:hypothetical protein
MDELEQALTPRGAKPRRQSGIGCSVR